MHPLADDAKGLGAAQRTAFEYSQANYAQREPCSVTATDSKSTALQLAAQVEDLAAEGLELYELLKDTDTGNWTSPTGFKGWTTWDIIAHLHFSDYMALTSLASATAFSRLLEDISASAGLTAFTQQWLATRSNSVLSGPALLSRWYATFDQLCQELAQADPEQRFQWAGPGMKARMLATARQMETWAHGWAIYDLMQQPRSHSDRLLPIVNIGVRTYAWTFRNRQREVPEPVPHLSLAAPSGEIWNFNNASNTECIRGSAVEFCQVVTQVRNVQDTGLEVTGGNAAAWMAIAQCFAGPPQDPPAPGSRVPRKIRSI